MTADESSILICQNIVDVDLPKLKYMIVLHNNAIDVELGCYPKMSKSTKIHISTR